MNPSGNIKKALLIALIFIAPVILVMLVFSPLVHKGKPFNLSKYQIPRDPDITDIIRLVANMRLDDEFQFYFLALKDKDIDKCIEDITGVLRDKKTRPQLHAELEGRQLLIKTLASLFYSLPIPDGFVNDRSVSPELSRVMDELLMEEFKLTVLGLSYKVLYDPKFEFRWDKASFLAAQKLRALVVGMKN